MANVSPECEYCLLGSEQISHLFWHCLIVGSFLNDVFTWVCNTGIPFNPTKDQFLFGYLNENSNTPKNYLILHLKKYIWSTKFKSTNNLTLVSFKNYFKNILKDLEIIKKIENKKIDTTAEFYVWNVLLDLLSVESQDLADHHRHLLPVQDGAPHDEV